MGIEKETEDIPEPLRSAVMLVVEKRKTDGWKINVKRPRYTDYPGPRVSVEVTSGDGAAHALARFDEDDSLPNKIERLIRSLQNA
jgi:hypothetical protein